MVWRIFWWDAFEGVERHEDVEAPTAADALVMFRLENERQCPRREARRMKWMRDAVTAQATAG